MKTTLRFCTAFALLMLFSAFTFAQPATPGADQQPANQQPAADQPAATQQPAADQPAATQQPAAATQQPAAGQPAAQETQLPGGPVMQAPGYQQPVYQQPVYGQPVYQQPMYSPMYQQPMYQQPMYQQPMYQEYYPPMNQYPHGQPYNPPANFHPYGQYNLQVLPANPEGGGDMIPMGNCNGNCGGITNLVQRCNCYKTQALCYCNENCEANYMDAGQRAACKAGCAAYGANLDCSKVAIVQ